MEKLQGVPKDVQACKAHGYLDPFFNWRSKTEISNSTRWPL